MTEIKTMFAGLAVAAAILGGATAASAQGVHYRPLTVAPHYGQRGYAPAPRGYNPYAGPGAIVTAPVHFAGTLATLPFRAVNSVFPPYGNTPLVIVGAPVYAAGKLVEAPFRIVESPFGGPAPFSDY